MPTKWERMVENGAWTSTPDMLLAAKLLARQHARMVQMVKKCQCDPEDGQMVENGYNQAKADILSALGKMDKK